MIDILTEILITIAKLVIDPINGLLTDMGNSGLDSIIIKLGFGSIEWINITLNDLLLIVLGLVLGFVLLRLIYGFIKWLFRLGKGLTGVR